MVTCLEGNKVSFYYWVGDGVSVVKLTLGIWLIGWDKGTEKSGRTGTLTRIGKLQVCLSDSTTLNPCLAWRRVTAQRLIAHEISTA